MSQTSYSPSPNLVEAIRLHQSGDLAGAEQAYRDLLMSEGQNAEILRLLGLLRLQQDDNGEAQRLLRQAIALAPDNAKAFDNLGVVLSAEGQLGDALTMFQSASRLAPDNAVFHYNLGSLSARLNRNADARQALAMAVQLDPRHVVARQALANELLKAGDPVAARFHLETCISMGQGHSAVLAHLAIALNESGDLANLQALANLDRMIVPSRIDAFGSFASLKDLNAALAGFIVDNKTLHDDHTTINGQDTGELLAAPEPCIVALRNFIYGRIEERLRALPDPTHPFTRLASHNWRTESWGVRMWNQGHQATHIHQKAWLSGVYYVRLPDVVRQPKTPDGHEGWIEFGAGPDELYVKSRPETRRIQPEEGLLLTFPSYFWHRTIPFASGGERLSISFDVIPKAV
jgi:Flp pilus assembly protein TadD